MKNLSRKMVEYRAKHDLTQQELAVKCGLGRITIVKIENGTQSPTRKTAAKILLVVDKKVGVNMNKVNSIKAVLNDIAVDSDFNKIERFADHDGYLFFQKLLRYFSIQQLEDLADEIVKDDGHIDYRFYITEYGTDGDYIELWGTDETDDVFEDEDTSNIVFNNCIRFMKRTEE